MSYTTCSVATNVIASLGTTPEERGLATEQFKAKFDQFATEFVAWFNATHIAEGNAHLADTLYQTAGGTATAITLTGVVLEDGHPKTFIASANNNGEATTINTKPLYKPNTTTAPALIAGKAYTVWYSTASGGRFFIKASAEGDAVVAEVLAGKKFSNDNDTGLVGTMTNNGAVSTDITTKAQEVTIAQGYHSGSGKVKISATEQAKIIPENILSGVTLLGETGTLHPGKFLSGSISGTGSTVQITTGWKPYAAAFVTGSGASSVIAISPSGQEMRIVDSSGLSFTYGTWSQSTYLQTGPTTAGVTYQYRIWGI